MPTRHHFMVAAITLLLVTPCLAKAESAQQTAREILEQSGIQGGLIVHVGCGDGTLTAALRAGDRYVVQGLEVDPAKVEQAREHIRSLGQYGTVSVTRWDGQSLPYADNLVNLVVVSGVGVQVRAEEFARILAPRGTVLVRQGLGLPDTRHLTPDTASAPPGWTKFVKSWPDTIDEWTHFLHGPDNNAVAQDTVVGPPQQMQWVTGPAYARSHEINSSMAAMVSAGGRLFYIWDDGPLGLTDERFPANWSLMARDAFNGVQLWKRPMPDWGWRQWHDASRWEDPRERAKMLRHSPPTLPRRLVATGDQLYVTLGYQAPVSVLDAATGDVLREIDETAWTDEILLADGVLVLRARIPDSPPDTDVWDVMPDRHRGRVMAVDAKSGRKLWQSDPDEMAPLTLATRNGRVFYSNYEQVVGLDRASGRELWRSPRVDGGSGHRATGGTLVAQDEVVLYAHAPASGKNYHGQLNAFSAETGKLLWSGPTYAGPGVANPPDLFVVDGSVWVGETRLPVDNSEIAMQRQGFDPASGEVVREVSVPKLTSPGHHYRCYRSKATQRYLLLPKRGVEFLDLLEKDHMRHDWLRAPCIYGVLPTNGMLYVAPHQCVCYQGVLLSNFNALTAERESKRDNVEESKSETRLTTGPAYGKIKNRQSAIKNPHDWPIYRREPRRSGSSSTTVPDRLERRWEVTLGGNVTPPVVADGRLLVAEKDTHTVHALDVDKGRKLWSYTAGARVDSPPTIHGPLVLFGSTDGWVYCLRASDGVEVWRFLAAPSDRRIAAFEQVESAWPVHGTVVVQDDVTTNPPRTLAYFTAGRSSFLDGGIRVWGLDPHTGEVVHETCVSGPRPNPFEDTGMAGYMDGAKSDILVSDGVDLYLHQERFRGDLSRIKAPMQKMAKEGGGFRIYPSFPDRGSDAKRLIATRGFLDDSYNEGTYWTYGQRWPGWDRKMRGVGAYGQLLVFDRRTVYGVHVFTESIRVRRGFMPGEKGYRLFARDHDAKEDKWSVHVPVRVRAIVLAGEKLFVAGPPDVVPAEDPLAAFEGRKGAVLWTISASNGQKLAEVQRLESLPAYDGLIAAAEHLFLSTTDGRVSCFGQQEP
ncbi:MAG: PQQ-binding-like beta-propeller repeat protein [Planctomycetes bacterium]|nr:PQQ-binding-like beta-propeller repeat protein [Planctomycetota bacterium]